MCKEKVRRIVLQAQAIESRRINLQSVHDRVPWRIVVLRQCNNVTFALRLAIASIRQGHVEGCLVLAAYSGMNHGC